MKLGIISNGAIMKTKRTQLPIQKYIIIYATTDGQTKKISQELQTLFMRTSTQVVLLSIDDVNSVILMEFDKIILGASIRYGKHSLKVHRFIEKYHDILNKKVCAFFSVNLVARKENKNQSFNNPYVIKFLKKTMWTPTRVAVFAGKLNYKKYKLIDRLMIQFIMYLTDGPTNKNSIVEFTDWNAVNFFAQDIVNCSNRK